MAPEIVLNCDHITPVAKGGTNEFVNLVTSCEACNSGKSDRALSESDAVKRQAAELLKLAERREQLQMMAEWRTELGKLDEEIMATEMKIKAEKDKIKEMIGLVSEAGELDEAKLTKGEKKEKEKIVKGMKKNKAEFKKDYGKDAEKVMYATATKMAQKKK